MYMCNEYTKVCITVREPECPRSPSTSSSVTGTGPGAACLPPDEPTPEPSPPPKLGCRVQVSVNNRARSYFAQKSTSSVRVC